MGFKLRIDGGTPIDFDTLTCLPFSAEVTGLYTVSANLSDCGGDSGGGDCCPATLLNTSDVEFEVTAPSPSAGSYDLGTWHLPSGGTVGWAGPAAVTAYPTGTPVSGFMYLVCDGSTFAFWFFQVDPGGPPAGPPDYAFAATPRCDAQDGTVNFGAFFAGSGTDQQWLWIN